MGNSPLFVASERGCRIRWCPAFSYERSRARCSQGPFRSSTAYASERSSRFSGGAVALGSSDWSLIPGRLSRLQKARCTKPSGQGGAHGSGVSRIGGAQDEGIERRLRTDSDVLPEAAMKSIPEFVRLCGYRRADRKED